MIKSKILAIDDDKRDMNKRIQFLRAQKKETEKERHIFVTNCLILRTYELLLTIKEHPHSLSRDSVCFVCADLSSLFCGEW